MVSWGAVSLLVVLLIGIAFGVLGMNPAQYVMAEVCFTIGGIILLARVGWWLGFEHPDAKLSHLSIIGAILFGLVGISWVISVRWIEDIRWVCNLHLAFSGSPAMTEVRKKRICKEFEAVQNYLVGIGYVPITRLPRYRSAHIWQPTQEVVPVEYSAIRARRTAIQLSSTIKQWTAGARCAAFT